MMALYPEPLRTLLLYIDALNAAEKQIIDDSVKRYTTDITLHIVVKQDDEVIGQLVDEIGGVWSFTDDKEIR